MGIWELYAEVYDSINLWLPYRKMLEAVIDELPVSSGGSVLDAGCGTGNLCRRLREKNRWAEIVGIDFSPAMLEKAGQKLKNANIRLLRMDLNQPLGFPGGRFDYLVSINTLYALDDPARALKEFHRVLKRGGRLVVVNPVSDIRPVSFNRRMGFDKDRIDSLGTVLDISLAVLINMVIYLRSRFNRYHFLSEADFREVLGRIGFNTVDFRYVPEDQSIIVIATK
ncbi:MAG: class I SAM-dependent methyltransferase [Firmicutes bacterium]|nr:class I SAM-dependent methyltransferase [Bacillota bacterium]